MLTPCCYSSMRDLCWEACILLGLHIHLQKLHHLLLQIICKLWYGTVRNICNFLLLDLKSGNIISCSQPSFAKDLTDNILSYRGVQPTLSLRWRMMFSLLCWVHARRLLLGKEASMTFVTAFSLSDQKTGGLGTPLSMTARWEKKGDQKTYQSVHAGT